MLVLQACHELNQMNEKTGTNGTMSTTTRLSKVSALGALRASLLSQDSEGYMKVHNALGRISGMIRDHEAQDLPVKYRWW